MSKLTIERNYLDRAVDRASLTDEEQIALLDYLNRNSPKNKYPKGHPLAMLKGSIAVDLNELPRGLLVALMDEPKLRPNQRAAITLHIHGMQQQSQDFKAIFQVMVSSPTEFGSTFSTMGRSTPNVEMAWNKRWYPIILYAEFTQEEGVVKNVLLRANLGIVEEQTELSWLVDPDLFLDEQGSPGEFSVQAILEKLGFRRIQQSAADFNLRLVRAERGAAEVGKQVWIRGNVMERTSRLWFGKGMSVRPLGTPEVPRRGVVERNLELYDDLDFRYRGERSRESSSRMPLLRIFSLDTKSYVYVDVDDVTDYEYDTNSLSKLCLPVRMIEILKRVFETPQSELFGDLIRGKHGGIVILASGNPGVGKTLTAEVYAEMNERPLYVLEFGELGTTVENIETHLQQVFSRVVRWNAVLQFDECEIFLSQRGNDLERTAIVGIFLRLLDYYEGLLFLTTNRPEVLDEAIRSRVMLRLEYPDLDSVSRQSIWRSMFEAAKLNLVDGTFEELSIHPVNGRQIRNLVRLARILHPQGTVSLSQMEDTLQYGCR